MRRGIVHRGHQAGRIFFVTESGLIKVLDFGLANVDAARERVELVGDADSDGR